MAHKSLRTKVFVSYSREDKRWLAALRPHLQTLARQEGVEIWDDTLIKAGSDWHAEIKAVLAATKVAVLLVSTNFLSSEFIIQEELPLLLQAADVGDVVILQLILSPCRVESHPDLSRLQFINEPSNSLKRMPVVKREEVFVKLTERIHEILAAAPKQLSRVGNQDEKPHPQSYTYKPSERIPNIDIPVSGSFMEALKMQYAACAANNVPLRFFHKLLLLIRIAPDYMSGCLTTVTPDFPAKLEAWLQRQVSKQLEQEAGQSRAHPSPDDDRTLKLARVMASDEGAAEVNIRHFFLALLADDTSATIKEIRATLGEERFDALVQTARTFHFSAKQTESIVSTLVL